MNKYLRFFLDPIFRLSVLSKKGFYNHLTDEFFLKKKYKMIFKQELNLDVPQTFNEKLQWLKLHNRKLIYTKMVDKFEVKDYVANAIGAEYIIPTLGVWDNFDEIDFDSLPEKFVLKCTHDSGGLVICKNKNNFDLKSAKIQIEKSLKSNYYWSGREWPYKNVRPRIIAEEYVQDGENLHLPVYKFFCFSGTPKIIQVIQNDKQPDESIDYFDTNWTLLELKQKFPNSQTSLPKPANLEKMLNMARELSQNIPFVRVDLYLINGMIKFSEFTFFTDSGFAKFEPVEWDKIIGKWVILPN